jgi:hypothetical protein
MDKTYCSHTECVQTGCDRHQIGAPSGTYISIADLLSDSCFISKPQQNIGVDVTNDRSRLLAAICRGTQNTNYKCDEVCKAMCSSVGDCYYCASIADVIVEEFRK